MEERKLAPKPAFQVYVPPGRRDIAREEERKEINSKRERDCQIYIPPGRRELKEKQDKKRRDDEAQNRVGDATEAIKRAQAPPKRVDPVDRPRAIVDDSEFATVFDDERLASSCLVLHGFAHDASDASKAAKTEPFARQGALVHWLGPQTCLLIFLNEATANRALSANSMSTMRPQPFSSTPYNNKVHLDGKHRLFSNFPSGI